MSFLHFYGNSMNTSADTLSKALSYAAETWPEQYALCASTRHWTWLELHQAVEQLAGYWTTLGVKEGDTVGCITDKTAEVVMAFLACCRLGAIFCPINFKLNSKHICDQIKTANVSVVMTQHNRAHVLIINLIR